MKTQKIYLIRHGETEWTRSGQHTGITDLPLTLQGHNQAESVRQMLQGVQFDHIFVSPRLRAQETCQCAGYGQYAVIEPDLAEWNYGLYEGLTSKQIWQKHSDWDIFAAGAPGGESPEEISARVMRLRAKLQNLTGNIALFSHGHFIRAFSATWIEQPLLFGRHLTLSTASVSILGYEHIFPAILLWNACFYS